MLGFRLLPAVSAFGFLGHAIVARLVWKLVPSLAGQYKNYQEYLQSVHYADQHKHEPQMAWAMPLHFYNNLRDTPPDYCSSLDHALRTGEPPNLIQGCVNFTRQVLQKGEASKTTVGYAIHFLTDLHQPLHLTGKERGGNGSHLEGKSLHFIWDTLLPRHLLAQPPFHGRVNRLVLYLRKQSVREERGGNVLDWAGQVNRLNCLGGIWPQEAVELEAYLILQRPRLIELLSQAASRIASILSQAKLV